LSLQDSSSHISPEDNPSHAPNLITPGATQSSAGTTNHFSGIPRNTASAINNLQPTSDVTDVVFSEPLKTLRDFNLFVDKTPNVLAFISTLYVTDLHA